VPSSARSRASSAGGGELTITVANAARAAPASRKTPTLA
jgi:hypothetical protein